jgi:hypothetical protein
MLLIGRVVGDESFTAALELTQTSHNDDDGSVVADSQGESLRFFVVFNIFATRARLGIIIPTGYGPMETLIQRQAQPGDWMSQAAQKSNIFEARTLARGLKIDARLNRNLSDLGLRSYEAEISFEGAVELPNNQVSLVQWQRPSQGLVELPNNEVKSFGGQTWRKLAAKLHGRRSGSQSLIVSSSSSVRFESEANRGGRTDYHIHSFPIFRELEKQRDLLRRGRCREAMELDDQS